MAIYDAMVEFSDNQAITSTAAATNVLDMQASDLEMGAGTPFYINFYCGTTFDSANDTATLTIALVNETDATIDGSSVVILQTKALAVADPELTAGGGFSFSLPVDFDYNQYVGVYYTVGTESFSAGNMDCWLANAPISGGLTPTQVSASNI